MTATRPLREVFDELAGDPSAAAELGTGPAGLLAASGHGDLPDSLVSEAIVSYADTAPASVAEHLAPFVRAHGPVPLDGPDGAGGEAAEPGAADGLALLATAPVEPGLDADGAEPAALDGTADLVSVGSAAEPDYGAGEGPDPYDLAFGEGGAAAEPDQPVLADEAGPGELGPDTPAPAFAGAGPDGPEPGVADEPDLFGPPAAPDAPEPPGGAGDDDGVDQWGGGAAG